MGVLTFTTEEMISSCIEMMRENYENEGSKKELIIEVDTFEQATQIFAYIIGKYTEVFSPVKDLPLLEKWNLGGREFHMYSMKIYDFYVSVGYNSFDENTFDDLSEDCFIVDLRSFELNYEV